MQPVPTSSSSVSSLSKPLTASLPPSSYAAAVSTVPAPVKKVGNWKPDVNPESAKKRLFQASHPLPLLPQPEPDQVAPCLDNDVESISRKKKTTYSRNCLLRYDVKPNKNFTLFPVKS